MKKRWVLHFDGSCTCPNGVARYGWTLHDPEGKLYGSGKGLVREGPGATCNAAEYGALEAGLLYLLNRGLTLPLLCLGDSRLVVNQVTGRWRVRTPSLRPWCDRVRDLLGKVSKDWSLQWISRDANTFADRLSR